MKDGNELQYDFEERSKRARLICDDPSLTLQSELEDADINVIVARFGLTGTMPEALNLPQYGDFEDVFDYQTAQNVLIQARDEFMKLPAKVRARFDNDPGEFMTFVHDPANADEMVALGLRDVVKDNVGASKDVSTNKEQASG